MKKSVRPNAVRFSILFLSLFSLSFRWPIEQPVVTSTFSESRGDHFHDGIDLVGSAGVYPVRDGKVLWYHRADDYPFEREPGPGNYVIIDHPGSHYSVYMHLKTIKTESGSVTSKSAFATVGNTGHSYGPHLHFTILEKKSFISVDALSLVGPMKDVIPPEIGRAALRIDEKIVYLRKNASIRLTKNYPLLIEIRDAMRGHEKLGISRIAATVNGQDVLDATFNRLIPSPKGLTANGKGFEDMFDPEGLYRINPMPWRRGGNRITVSAWDIAGNRTNKDFVIDVKLEADSGKNE